MLATVFLTRFVCWNQIKRKSNGRSNNQHRPANKARIGCCTQDSPSLSFLLSPFFVASSLFARNLEFTRKEWFTGKRRTQWIIVWSFRAGPDLYSYCPFLVANISRVSAAVMQTSYFLPPPQNVPKSTKKNTEDEKDDVYVDVVYVCPWKAG